MRLIFHLLIYGIQAMCIFIGYISYITLVFSNVALRYLFFVELIIGAALSTCPATSDAISCELHTNAVYCKCCIVQPATDAWLHFKVPSTRLMDMIVKHACDILPSICSPHITHHLIRRKTKSLPAQMWDFMLECWNVQWVCIRDPAPVAS